MSCVDYIEEKKKQLKILSNNGHFSLNYISEKKHDTPQKGKLLVYNSQLNHQIMYEWMYEYD